MKTTASRLCTAMFGIGLFCGLSIHSDSLVHNLSVTMVGVAVFYVTEAAVRKFGNSKHNNVSTIR